MVGIGFQISTHVVAGVLARRAGQGLRGGEAVVVLADLVRAAGHAAAAAIGLIELDVDAGAVAVEHPGRRTSPGIAEVDALASLTRVSHIRAAHTALAAVLSILAKVAAAARVSAECGPSRAGLRGDAGASLAELIGRASGGAIPAVVRRGLQIDAGAAAVGRAGWALQVGAGAFFADLTDRTGIATPAAMQGIPLQISAFAVAQGIAVSA
jgi:hypothetical protein